MKLVLALSTFLCLVTNIANAEAQPAANNTQSTTTISTKASDTDASLGPQAQSTTQVDQHLESAKKWHTGLLIGAFANVGDLKANGSRAMVDSANLLTILNAVTPKLKVGIGHNFSLRAIGDRSQLNGYNSDNGPQSVYRTDDPTIHLNYKMPKLLGSNEYSILSRYYVPVSEASRATNSNGTLRTQAFITWTMNPHIDLSFYGQARLYLNSVNNTNTATGADSVLRTIVGTVFGYNLNSVWNAYYLPYLDMRSAGFQRGNFNADVANNFSQEAGLWISVPGDKFVINPAWVTTSSKIGKSTYEGSGEDANSEYDLNLIASF